METFKKLGLAREALKPIRTPLAGFTGDSIESERSIKLQVELGSYPNTKTLELEFVVVHLECSHNVILRRPSLEDLGAMISLQYLCMKFRTPNWVGTVRSDQRATLDCYLQARWKIGKSDLWVHTITEQAEKIERVPERPEPAMELEEVEIDPAHPERRARIEKGLPEMVKESLVRVLREFKSIFAWEPEDMPGLNIPSGWLMWYWFQSPQLGRCVSTTRI